MKTFDFKSYVQNLPDCYAKSVESNNHKLLEIPRISLDGLFVEIDSVLETLDIEKATGETLDMYGEMLSQPRGLASDAQYRMLIRSKLMQNLSSGDYKSVVNAICVTFNCPPSEVLIKEVEGEPCAVELALLPVDTINKAGMTISQTVALVKRLLPAGVRLVQYSFEGTFMFEDEDWVETTTNGFASDDGTIKGGYLGTIGHYSGESVLPTE